MAALFVMVLLSGDLSFLNDHFLKLGILRVLFGVISSKTAMNRDQL